MVPWSGFFSLLFYLSIHLIHNMTVVHGGFLLHRQFFFHPLCKVLEIIEPRIHTNTHMEMENTKTTHTVKRIWVIKRPIGRVREHLRKKIIRWKWLFNNVLSTHFKNINSLWIPQKSSTVEFHWVCLVQSRYIAISKIRRITITTMWSLWLPKQKKTCSILIGNLVIKQYNNKSWKHTRQNFHSLNEHMSWGNTNEILFW